MAINAQTDMPDEAWAFAQFMTDEENLKYRAIEGGYIPGRSSLLNAPKWKRRTDRRASQRDPR